MTKKELQEKLSNLGIYWTRQGSIMQLNKQQLEELYETFKDSVFRVNGTDYFASKEGHYERKE